MKKTLYLLSLMVLCSLGSFAQNCTELWVASKEFNSFSEYIENGCKDSLAEAYLYNGIAKINYQNFDGAILDFEHSIQLKPSLSEAWYWLAHENYFIKKDSLAMEMINKAIQYNARDIKYLMLRGDIFSSMENYEDGYKDYRLSESLVNNEPQKLYKIYIALGGTSISLSLDTVNQKDKEFKLNEGIEYLNKALAIDSSKVTPYLLLGNAYNCLQNYDKSIEYYQYCLKLDGGNGDVKLNLSITYREIGKRAGEQMDIPKAIEYLVKAHELNPKDFETVRLLGVAHAFRGERKKALVWFQKSVEIEPRNAHSWWDLGTAYLQNSNNIEYEKCRKKAKELDPNIEENIK